MVNWVIGLFLLPSPLVFALCVWASEENPKLYQVLVRTEVSRGEEYPLKIRGTLLIEAGPEVVWGVLTDYENLEGVFPRLVKTQILGRNSEEVVVEQVYHGLLFLSKSMQFASRETPMQRIDFRRLGGKSKVVGYWSLKAMPEGFTLLTLELAVRPRRLIPLRYMKNTLKGHVPQGLLSIRQKSLARLNKNSPEEPKIIHIGEEEKTDNPTSTDF
jgi:hypothetical protein